jgi:hypothetical protein
MCWIAKFCSHSREIHGVSGRVLARLSRPHDEGVEAFFALDGVGHPLETQLVPALDGLFLFFKAANNTHQLIRKYSINHFKRFGCFGEFQRP